MRQIRLSPRELGIGAARVIAVAVPNGGWALMLAESYFDETNTHHSDDRLCVAGYVFEKSAAEDQAGRWAKMLEKWKLPYFHMVDCAHNVEAFAHLTLTECDLAAREAIQIIKDTASTGIYVTVLESDYLAYFPQLRFLGSAYDYCAREMLTGVSAWIEHAKFEGAMHYFFEAGAETESHASWSILQMVQDQEIREESCYAGHSFVRKECSPGVQAADLLAWHSGQDCKRAIRGERRRKDFASLTEIPHRGHHYTREKLQEQATIVNSMLKQAGMTNEMADEIERLAKRYASKLGQKKS